MSPAILGLLFKPFIVFAALIALRFAAIGVKKYIPAGKIKALLLKEF